MQSSASYRFLAGFTLRVWRCRRCVPQKRWACCDLHEDRTQNTAVLIVSDVRSLCPTYCRGFRGGEGRMDEKREGAENSPFIMWYSSVASVVRVLATSVLVYLHSRYRASSGYLYSVSNGWRVLSAGPEHLGLTAVLESLMINFSYCRRRAVPAHCTGDDMLSGGQGIPFCSGAAFKSCGAIASNVAL
jgi:hypothetical protein